VALPSVPTNVTCRNLIKYAAAAAILAGCGGSSNTASSDAPVKPDATIGVASNGNLGKIIVDSNGDTVYLFQKDTGGKSACSGACATAWPPLIATGKPTVSGGLSDGKVSTTRRSDGKSQVTYAGHPLYRYQGDSKPGDASGQGLNAFGASWYVVSSSGAAVTKGGSSGGGYGY
jgi:predicted lipoprotein with Yx(FWY)xxD motif